MSKVPTHVPPSMVVIPAVEKTPIPIEPAKVNPTIDPGHIDQFEPADVNTVPLVDASGGSIARGVFGDVPRKFVKHITTSVKEAYEELCEYLGEKRPAQTVETKAVIEDYFDAVDSVARRAAAGSEAAVLALDEVIDDLVTVVYFGPGIAQAFLERQERRMPEDLKPTRKRRAEASGLEERLVRRAHVLDYLWFLYRGIARKALSNDGDLDAQPGYILFEYLSVLEKDLIATSVLNVVAPMRKDDKDRLLRDVSAFRTEYVRLGKNVALLINGLDVDAIVQMMIDDPQTWVRQMDALRFAGDSPAPLWGIQELVHVLKLYAELKKDRSFEFGVGALADKAILMDDRRVFDYFMALAIRHPIARSRYLECLRVMPDSNRFDEYKRQSFKVLAAEGDPTAAAIHVELDNESSNRVGDASPRDSSSREEHPVPYTNSK